jgi:hypothetical protein
MMLVRVPLLSGLALLSACAAQGPFPSLAPRAVERGLAGGSAPAPCPIESGAAGTAESAPAPAPVPSDPALRGRVAELLAQARSGQAAFAEILPQAERGVGRAGAAGSDAWVSAQQDISRLEAARSRTVDALTELDSLSIARSAPGASNPEDLEAVVQAEEEARALAERQQAELSRLSGQLSAP